MILNRGASLLILGLSIRAGALIWGFIGLDLLIHLSQNNWVLLSANAGGVFFGCLYGNAPTLFRRRSKTPKGATIYDIHSGMPVSEDEKFMDAMLARISLHGEDSLSAEEKLRMEQISRKSLKERN